MTIRHIAAGLALILLAGCSARVPAPPRQAATPVLPPTILDAEQACLVELRNGRVQYEPLQSFETDQGCGIANPVRVTAASVPWNRPAILSCRLATQVQRYEIELVQPIALRHFGQTVRRIHHAGTYDCRAKRTQQVRAGGGSRGGSLSEHAKGRAIDITAFELADGSLVSVKNHWKAGGARQAFLHELAKASCGMFNVVLTPNHDYLHRDHFHLDIGPYTRCGY